MPVNKKQVMRLIKFVAEMRKHAYPNASTFVKMLKQLDLNENLNISCTQRTFMRDLATLKADFNAPIEFDPQNNGYFLTRETWEFQVPFMDDDMVMAAMLGARLAEDIVPSPLKEQIRDAVDNSLADNNSELMDRTYIETLLIASCPKTSVEPGIFGTVFQAWRERRVLELTYKKGETGEVTNRKFEPHIVAYHHGNWYAKGVDLAEKKVIVLAIFRIQSASIMDRSFGIRKDILTQTKKEGLFDYPKLENIKVRCAKEIAYYLYEQRKSIGLTITPQADGSLIVILPPSPEHKAIRWILGEGGNIEVLEPRSLRKKIHDFAQKSADLNKV